MRSVFKKAALSVPHIFLFIFGLTLACGLSYSLRIYHDFDVPSKESLIAMTSTGLTLTDKSGEEFFTFDVPGRKTLIPYNQIPPHIIQALVSAEDKTFFSHVGVSPTGILRAAYLDIQSRSFAYGGSTITQQLAKTILLDPSKSLQRKYREAIFAIKMDQTFSKEDILEMYLNVAYFGGGAYGIEEAAQTYFGKSAGDLSIAEGSYIIGMLPAPTTLSPFSGNERLTEKRQAYVLNRMREDGVISQSQYDEALQEELALQPTPPAPHSTAPHFALWVRGQLQRHFSPEFIVNSGLVVTTTLDLTTQQMLESSAQSHLQTIGSQGASNAAAVVVKPGTGEVSAMLGSINWRNETFGKYNMAVTPRQTGSSFKPIVYAAGLQQRSITLASVLNDTPKTYGKDYRPQNYNKRYSGRVLVRHALANSLNIPSVDLIDKIGPASVAALTSRLGVTSLSKDAPHNLSLALGTEAISPLELTAAYAAFAAGGEYVPPTGIVRIVDKHGNDVEFPKSKPKQVLSREVAFMITSVLSDNRARRATFGSSLELDRPAAVKTGTTQDYRDAWTVGYTPTQALGVWIGNNDNTPMRNLPGAVGAAPLWREVMTSLHTSTPPAEFAQPSSVVATSICPRLGLLSRSERGGVKEYFIAGTEPTRYCPAPSPTPLPEDHGDESIPEEDGEPIPFIAGI